MMLNLCGGTGNSRVFSAFNRGMGSASHRDLPVGAYRGDFVAWTGGCGFLGMGGGGPINPHSHYAIQLAIGAPSGLRVRSGEDAEWRPCSAALMPSRLTHTIDVNACEWSAVLFIEPETAEGKAISARLRNELEELDDDALAAGVRRLEQAWRVEQDHAAVGAACMALVQTVSRTAPRVPSDPRVLAAVEFIRQRVDRPITLADVAEATHLSPGRFRHLFVQETGMPLRAYVLWRRLLHVWTLLAEGETLTTAAHAAGFADSAHLSRTARTMFGLPPSALNMTGPLSQRSRRAPVHLG
jgi:AraC family transcriptional regulator